MSSDHHEELFKSTTAGRPNPAMAAWLNMLPQRTPRASRSRTSTRIEKPSSRNPSPQAAANRRKTVLAALPSAKLASATASTARDQQTLHPESTDQPLRPASWHPSSTMMQSVRLNQHEQPPPPLPSHLPHLTGQATASSSTLEPLPNEFHPLYDAAFLAVDPEPARAPTHLDYFELSGSPSEQAGQSSQAAASEAAVAESDFSACSKQDSSLATSFDSTSGKPSFLTSWTSWAETARKNRIQEGEEDTFADASTDLVGLGLYEQQAPSTLWESSFDAPLTSFDTLPVPDTAGHGLKLEESWRPRQLRPVRRYESRADDYDMDAEGYLDHAHAASGLQSSHRHAIPASNPSTSITPALPPRSLLREADAYRSLLEPNVLDDGPVFSGAPTPLQTEHRLLGTPLQPRAGEYVVPFGHATPLMEAQRQGDSLRPLRAQPPRQFDFPGGPYLPPPPRPSQMNAHGPQRWLPQPTPPTMHPGHAQLAQLAQDATHQAITPAAPPAYAWHGYSYDNDPGTNFFF